MVKSLRKTSMNEKNIICKNIKANQPKHVGEDKEIIFD